VSVSDLALGADEAAHVLHHADDRQLDLLTEADLLPHVLQRHLLEREGGRERKVKKEGEEADNVVYEGSIFLNKHYLVFDISFSVHIEQFE